MKYGQLQQTTSSRKPLLSLMLSPAMKDDSSINDDLASFVASLVDSDPDDY
jgi:hypothetical protein